ncbi:cytochrome c biogenesis protein DipZ [Candidatus Dojkabacteria bacterium]|uniref:Cytochrome c biogenesis protein DipZ n=1 Tax=Candidatus Dojkabacteria bacterium TaxID=2099670 RepID=A0A955LBT1_9BACT|nr:cytochrome c biogenesis protein DipZ [Candidatus Dojkabacteria bacterium]
MSLLVLSFFAGILTVFAPCVFTLLPVVLGGSLGSRSWHKPLVIILSLSASIFVFTLVLKVLSLFANVPQSFWQVASGAILMMFGIVTVFPELWDRFSYWLGLSSKSNRIMQEGSEKEGIVGEILVGAALGPVFSSCSPTYALIIVTILPEDFSTGLLYLISYTIGLALTLMLIAYFGQKLTSRLKWAVNPHGLFKKFLGSIFIILGIGIITGFIAKFENYLLESGLFNVTNIEFNLLENMEDNKTTTNNSGEQVELSVTNPYKAPEIQGIAQWINSNGETIESLKGKVVLIDFWTYSCINCIRTIPFVEGWYEKYKDDGFVVIGVHAPEFSFEKDFENVKKAVGDYKIAYPVAMDNDFKTWRAYDNHYWPAHYFIDKEGNVVHTHFGEGKYDESEMVIRYLLGLDNMSDVENKNVNVPITSNQTQETYIGYNRIERNSNYSQIAYDTKKTYTADTDLSSNMWSFGGNWKIEGERATAGTDATISMKFNAKDVYLVLGAEQESKISVKIDGQLQHLGADANENGEITINEKKLYKLVHSDEFLKDSVLEITFGEGVAAYAFTFGS